ncbi:MAG: DMT family transporter [Akkermansiaceae bacterium]|nr:DMT family transporter [Akkermansiaceae bacterium]
MILSLSKPVLLLVLASALWGLSFPVVKALHLEQSLRIPDAGTTFLAIWMQVARFLVAALILAPLMLGRPRPTGNEWRQGLGLALSGGLGMGVQAWGLAHTEASTSAFLTQAYCVFLPLIACFKSRSRPSLRIIGATTLVLVGGAILAGLRPDDLRLGIGESATLLAALIFTFQILILENPRYAANRGTPVTFLMFLGIAIGYLPFAFLSAPTPAAVWTAGASVPAAAFVLILALFCSVLAFLLMNTWQKEVSATEAGLIYTMEPIFAAIYALFLPALFAGLAGFHYPNETLTQAMILGGGLILAANLWMQWPAKTRRPAHP